MKMNDLDTVSIAAGAFLMGSPAGEPGRRPDEGPQHKVEISQLDCMRYPVTRRLYASVMGIDPAQSWFEYARRIGRSLEGWASEPDSAPTTWLRWTEAIQFCNALSERNGLEPCYALAGLPSTNASYDSKVTWNRSAGGFRLPTEAEWEYACRAGSTTRWSHGDDEAALGRYAWLRERIDSTPHAVGEKAPNPSGLFDMHGNVAEWCYDSCRAYTPDDRRHPHPIGDAVNIYRAARGGSGHGDPSGCRSAARNSLMRTTVNVTLGFRCVRGPS